VFHQIYPRSFADANGDGIRDLDAITAHLDYLNDGAARAPGGDTLWRPSKRWSSRSNRRGTADFAD